MMTGTHPQLVMNSPRLFEDFRLKDSSSEHIREITVVESAYDSVLCADFTYVSTPITSGAILYAALDAAGLSSLEEIRQDKAFFYENVIRPNIDAAESVAQTMLSLGGAVIAPAAFEAKSLGWGQNEYMGLWLDTIERKATRLAMVDGWEYSNGGCEEYLQALLMQAGRRDRNNIQIVDARGTSISCVSALRLMTTAIRSLINRGFSPTVLLQVLWRCFTLHEMVDTESRYGQSIDTCGKMCFAPGKDYRHSLTDPDDIRDLYRHARDLFTEYTHIYTPPVHRVMSSRDLSPTLIRQSEREELLATGSTTRRRLVD